MPTAEEHVFAAEKATKAVFAPGGTLQQAQQAQAAGGLMAFLQSLLAQLGPIIGPMIISLIQGLLVHATPTPAPTTK